MKRVGEIDVALARLFKKRQTATRVFGQLGRIDRAIDRLQKEGEALGRCSACGGDCGQC